LIHLVRVVMGFFINQGASSIAFFKLIFALFVAIKDSGFFIFERVCSYCAGV